MKKLPIVFISLVLVSCHPPVNKYKIYKVTFEIHYPTRVDTAFVEGECKNTPYESAYKGTNYIGDELFTLYSSTAPLKIIKSESIE